MRDLPPTKLVKTEEHTVTFSSYDVVTVHDNMRLGQVFRPQGMATWTACIVTTHPRYGKGLKVVGYRRTRSAASQRVVEAWLAPIDEEEAYAILEAIQAGVQQANEHAMQQLAANPEQRLTPGAFGQTLPFSVSTSQVVANLALDRQDLAYRLAGIKPCEDHYLRHNAYMIRMAELELEGRENRKEAQHEALVPSGDDSEGVKVLPPEEWARRVRELAEELGRAQAHSVRRPGLSYRWLDDGELIEEVVFSKRTLCRQREQGHVNVDALRTAAFAYQLALNASHERALCDLRDEEM